MFLGISINMIVACRKRKIMHHCLRLRGLPMIVVDDKSVSRRFWQFSKRENVVKHSTILDRLNRKTLLK